MITSNNGFFIVGNLDKVNHRLPRSPFLLFFQIIQISKHLFFIHAVANKLWLPPPRGNWKFSSVHCWAFRWKSDMCMDKNVTDERTTVHAPAGVCSLRRTPRRSTSVTSQPGRRCLHTCESSSAFCSGGSPNSACSQW